VGGSDDEVSVRTTIRSRFFARLRARNAEGFESEAVCVDPKRYDLLLRRAKPEETLVEARRVSNVQIDLWTWL